MFGGIAAHITDSDGDSISHADYTELGNRVLFEIFGDELGGVPNGEEVSSRS